MHYEKLKLVNLHDLKIRRNQSDFEKYFAGYCKLLASPSPPLSAVEKLKRKILMHIY